MNDQVSVFDNYTINVTCNKEHRTWHLGNESTKGNFLANFKGTGLYLKFKGGIATKLKTNVHTSLVGYMLPKFFFRDLLETSV